MTRPTTPAAILQRWATGPLDFTPGTRFQYSNTGYVAAGLIVERVSGEPLFTFLRELVFDRIGMHPTDADDGLPATAPLGHSRYGLGPVHLAAPIAHGWSFGSADIVATASDLALWDISTIQRSLMSPTAYATQQRDQLLKDGRGTGYRLGVDVGDFQGRRRIKNSGGFSGFYSENRIYPDDGAAIVALINADYGDAEVVIADAVEQQVFAEESGVLRAKALYEMLMDGKLDRARCTDHANAYFTMSALNEARASLHPLGSPASITQLESGVRGGFTEEKFTLDFGARNLAFTVRAEPGPHGRIEEAIVSPISEN